MAPEISNNDSYKQLSELYAKRKEEHARAMGALESYKQQKERAQTALKNSLYVLREAANECLDADLQSEVITLIQQGEQLQMDPQHVTEFSQHVNALCVKIENKLKELLA